MALSVPVQAAQWDVMEMPVAGAASMASAALGQC